MRVRFAPSPTGRFHIGSARTALYNYLLAKQTGGQFILRIEDTDQKRSTPESLAEIVTAMRWLGLTWDEGPDVGGPYAPYTQMPRRELYRRYARQLLENGHAYRCFCTPERLTELRADQQKLKQQSRYDGRCRTLDHSEAEARAAAGEKHVIRFKTPLTGATTVHDALRGDITVDNSTLDDFILVKSDGLALYHLAAMVDDHLMDITHVLRGSEWLGTLPLHALILRAFGWAEPVWCHLSVFLKPTGKGKMSKRDVTSEQSIFVLELREMGYVPEAINTWVALMGASFGSEERQLTMAEMVSAFDIDHLNPSPARVNFEKLDHFNGACLRRLTPDDLAARIQPFFARAGLTVDLAALQPIVPIIQERITTLDDAVAMAGFFFRPDPELQVADLLGQDLTLPRSMAALQRAHAELSRLPDFAHATTEPPMRALAEELGLKPGQFFGLLRLAITGQTVSPPLFECMAIVGQAAVLRRLQTAQALLEQAAA